MADFIVQITQQEPPEVIVTPAGTGPQGPAGPQGPPGPPGTIAQATETVVGGGELATQGETNTGTDDQRIVTPAKLKNSTALDSRYVRISGDPADGNFFEWDEALGMLVPVAAPGGGSGYRTLVTLDSDVSTTSTTYVDVTGLGFSVTSGVTYRFSFLIAYDAQAATIGAAFALNGPAITRLHCVVQWPSAGATLSTRYSSSYDNGAAVGASAFGTGGNVATIEGLIVPSASGTLIARFLAENVASNQITVKAGSTVEWW